MKVEPIKTRIVKVGDDFFKFLADYINTLSEKSIVIVTSKILALSEGSVVKVKSGSRQEKHSLVQNEAEFFLDAEESAFDLMLTVKHNILAVNAGIDQSNAGKNYVLLPKKPYLWALKIWYFLRKEYKVNQVGVLITDSKTFPLKWGTMGTSLAHCGFSSLNNKIGEKDLFGYEMQMTQINVAEALAAAAVLEMGEVAESQPLCVITEADMVEFQNRPPTDAEIEALRINLADDVYAPILMKANWKTKKEKNEENN